MPSWQTSFTMATRFRESFGRWCKSVGPTLMLLVLLAIFVVAPFISNQDSKKKDAARLQELQIWNATDTQYAAWEREQAIQFSLEQSVTMVHYLFAAAVGGLVFLVNAFRAYDVPRSEQPHHKPRGGEVLFAAATAFSFLVSILFGYFAYGYLPQLASSETFSIYDMYGRCASAQALCFLAGAGALSVLMLFRLWQAVAGDSVQATHS